MTNNIIPPGGNSSVIVSAGEILYDIFPGYKRLGGAPFNFIYHIRRLLGNGYLLSRIGADGPGQEILSRLTSENIPVDFIEIDSVHPTGTAIVEINESSEPGFIITEDCAYDFIRATPGIRNLLDQGCGLFYYGTLAQRSSTSREAIQSLWGYNTKYFYDVNIRQHFFNEKLLRSSLRAADVVKVNLEELQLLNELLLGEPFEMINTARRLMSEFRIDMFCVTMGSNGACLLKGDEIDRHKVLVDNVVDTVGAGDAYSAILATGYLMGWDLKRINGIACEFAAGICRVSGALSEDDAFYAHFRSLIAGPESTR